MNSPLLFSVIVPTHQRNDLLAKCLDCLAPGVQTLPAQQYEVIVTDDGSQITAEEMIREKYPWAKWVAGFRKGPAANRNNGAKYAQGEWLAFTDDDCLADSNWLEAYAEAILAEPSCLVFEGRTYVDRPKRSLADKAPVNESGGYLWSCNFAMQKQLFESMEGFDERFPYAAMEDIDLRLRLTKLGYKFCFVKSAAVCHPWRPQGGWKELKQHQESTFIYLSIHPEENTRLNYIYYLRAVFRQLIKSTIPGAIKFHGRGVEKAVLHCLLQLENMWIIFLKSELLKFSNKFYDKH